jgi:uncharacterized membrane protein
MTDFNRHEERAVTNPPPLVSDHGLVIAVYILYLVGFFNGITALAGVIIAYMQVGRSDQISQSHFRFQIRTFWIGLLYLVVGWITTFVFIGVLILYGGVSGRLLDA